MLGESGIIDFMKKYKSFQPKTPFKQRIILVLFGIFLFFALLELSLRLGGFFILFIQEHRNAQSIKQKSAYRIMCLGESTTAFGGEYSWPAQLEYILNTKKTKLNFSFKVINKGVAGCNSFFILNELDNNLTIYKPDLVIVMMGINDGRGALTFNALQGNRIASFFTSFKVVKLIRLIWFRILKFSDIKRKKQFTNKISVLHTERNVPSDKNSYRDFKHDYDSVIGKDYRKDKYSETEIVLEQAVKLAPSDPVALRELGSCYDSLGRFSDAVSVLEQAVKLAPSDPVALGELGFCYKRLGRLSEALVVLNKAAEIDSGYMIYIYLGMVYNAMEEYSKAENMLKKAIGINPSESLSRLELEKVYRAQGKPIENENMYKNYIDNYRRLKEKILEKGLYLVCVQYPMRSIEPLKKIFENDKQGIIFVDNEYMFKEAVHKGGHKEYFVDMFAEDFGHCTPKGNRLLAGNIANVILKEIFNK
jgi:tetratricopeptide (TPR) repeat protein